MSEERRRLTPEEITDEIHELARSGDDANKRWALKMLAPEEKKDHFLVEPLGVHEVRERGVRMMRAWGMALTQMMWNTAFAGSQHRAPTDDLNISANDDMIPPDALVYINKMTRIKHLYVLAPELKKPGTMYGTPRRGGKAAVARFVQEQAKKVVIERVRTHRDWFTGRLLAPQEKESDGIPPPMETEGVPSLGD